MSIRIMSITKIIIPLFVFATVFFSCTKKNTHFDIKGDYLIAGRTGGFIEPSANATYYLVSNGALRADNSEAYRSIPTNANNFNFSVVLPASKYDSVKDLITSIPAELFAKNNADIGLLVEDAGYFDVRVSINGVAYKWTFEADQTSSSPAVQQFVQRLNNNF